MKQAPQFTSRSAANSKSRAIVLCCSESSSLSSCTAPTCPLCATWPAAGRFFLRADDHHRAAHGNHVARPDETEMDALAVDLGAVGALQIGKDQLAVVFLDLQMEAADSFVVESTGLPSSRPTVSGVEMSRGLPAIYPIQDP